LGGRRGVGGVGGREGGYFTGSQARTARNERQPLEKCDRKILSHGVPSAAPLAENHPLTSAHWSRNHKIRYCLDRQEQNDIFLCL